MSNSNINDEQRSDIVRRLLGGLLRLAAFVVVGLLAWSSIVFVDETELVLVERLGHITAVYDRPIDRGLHMKLPWPVSRVRRFDRRVQLFDPPGREMFTRDKKNITVDTYVCWKIAEASDESSALLERPVVRFFRSLGNVDVAQARLDSRIRSILATEIGRGELSELLSVENPEEGPETTEAAPLRMIAEFVTKSVRQRADEAETLADRLGIEIVDVRIKRINFPVGNQQAVFERMKSERKKIADRYRSAGLAENTVIKSQADRQYNELLSKADADAERIRGEGEAEALTILNKAHAEDPEFYRVIRTLDAYRKILNSRTTLVLSASSNLLKILTEGIPEAGELPEEKPNADVPPATSNRIEPSKPQVTQRDEATPSGKGVTP